MTSTLKLTNRVAVVAVAMTLMLFFVPLSADAVDYSLDDFSGATSSQYTDRWRNDDGSEVGANWAAEENAVLENMNQGQAHRLRFGVSNSSLSTSFEMENWVSFERENSPQTSIIDSDRGFAYFGTATNPAKIIKIDLNTYKRAGTIHLAPSAPINNTGLSPTAGERMNFSASNLVGSVIDTQRGYAYFVSNETSSKFIKVDLHTFTVVGYLTLGVQSPQSAIIDTSGSVHYAYVAHDVNPGQVTKINLDTFQSVGTLMIGSIMLDDGGNDTNLLAGAIDTAHGYAYFTTNTVPGELVRVRLSDFSYVDSLQLEVEFGMGSSIALDTSGSTQYAYIGFNSQSMGGYIRKVDLNNFVLDGSAIETDLGYNYLSSASIDTAGGYVYFSNNNLNGAFLRLNTVNSTLATASFDSTDDYAATHVLDPVNGYAYVGVQSVSGRVLRVNLGSMRDVVRIIEPLRTATASYDTLNLGLNEYDVTSALLDSTNGYAYFGVNSFDIGDVAILESNTATTRVVKVDLETLSRVDEIALDSIVLGVTPADLPAGAVIDPTGTMAYFGTSDGQLVRINLEQMSIAGTISLGAPGYPVLAGVIDSTGTYGYFSLGGFAISKVNLSTFGSVMLFPMPMGIGPIYTGVMGPNDQYVYFAQENGSLFKLDAMTGAIVGDPIMLGGTTSSAVTESLDTIIPPAASVVDPINNVAYFARGADIYQIDLSNFSISGGVTVPDLQVGYLNVAGIDVDKQLAIFGGGGSMSRLYLVDLSNGLSVSNYLTQQTYNGYQGGILDPTRGYFYAGLDNSNPTMVTRASYALQRHYQLDYALYPGTACDFISDSEWTRVPAIAGAEHFVMSNSTYLTDGEATTNVENGLTDPVDRNIQGAAQPIIGIPYSFRAGQVRDTQPVTSRVPLMYQEFTELEYALEPTSNAQVGSRYCFRLTDLSNASNITVSQYGQAVVTGTGASGHCDRPQINLSVPDGGEVYTAGGSADIFWGAFGCDVTGVRVSLSTDSGETYPTILAENVYANGGFYRWEIPADQLNTTQGRIMLELLGIGGEVRAMDASEGDFTVQGGSEPPTPEPTDPTGGGGELFDPQGIGAGTAGPLTIDENQELPFADPEVAQLCEPGTVLLGSAETVWYCGRDQLKHQFPNLQTYQTWYDDWGSVIPVADALLAQIPTGDIVYYYPGKRMVKVPASVATYAVNRNGVLHWVPTEATAELVYGPDWNDFIDDMSASIFAQYTIGEPLNEDGTLPALSATLAAGDTLWSVVKEGASNLGVKKDLLTLARQVAKANDLAVPEWGIKGLKNARALKTGSRLDLAPVFNALRNR